MTVQPRLLTIAMAICALGWQAWPARAQQTPLQPSAPAADSAQGAERQTILSSERWRQAEGNFEKWLDIQQIYSPAEVAALKADFAARAAKMSPAELKKLLSDMEGRLAVLLSPDADEARKWLGELMAVARNPEAHLGGPLPDVANMSAEGIRAELDRFQQRRAAQQRSQAAFNRGRERQVQGARNLQASRRGAQSRVQNRPAPKIADAAPGAPISPYALWQLEPVSRRPVYQVGPWGEPIYWDPLDYWNRPRQRW